MPWRLADSDTSHLALSPLSPLSRRISKCLMNVSVSKCLEMSHECLCLEMSRNVSKCLISKCRGQRSPNMHASIGRATRSERASERARHTDLHDTSSVPALAGAAGPPSACSGRVCVHPKAPRLGVAIPKTLPGQDGSAGPARGAARWSSETVRAGAATAAAAGAGAAVLAPAPAQRRSAKTGTPAQLPLARTKPCALSGPSLQPPPPPPRRRAESCRLGSRRRGRCSRSRLA